MSTSFHLPQINQVNNNNTKAASLPTTPKSSNSSTTTATKFHYDPYNNFNRVYMTHSPGSATPTPRSTSVSSRGHSRSASKVLQEQQQDHQVLYNYKNTTSSQDNSSYDDEDDDQDVHVSGTCTPARRMETEQQFQQADSTNMMMQVAVALPKPRSSNQVNNNNNNNNNSHNQQQQQDENADHHEEDAVQLMEEQRQQGSNTLRATTRTMQHLLQNVPYLFLDSVAESTVLCRNPHHRVGQHIMAWSNPKTPAELEQEFPERYQGQNIRDIFVAQLPFDLPLDVIQLVADLLIEGPRIHVLHAAPHIKLHKSYDGCSFVKMFECDAIRFITSMHKRVLFDVDGVWVATTLPELQELTDYCAWFQEQKHEQRKEILKMPTPFSAMTAEFALRGSRRATANFYDNRPYPNSNTNNAMMMQQQQQQQPRQANHHNQQQQHTAPYYAASAPHQHSHYNAVYDQNPHQRQVGSYFGAAYNNNTNNNNNTNQYQQQQQQQPHQSSTVAPTSTTSRPHQQQGIYQQGCSFYPNQAQIQYLAPHQQRALRNSGY